MRGTPTVDPAARPMLVTVALTLGSGALLDRCSVLPDVPDASVGR